VLYSFICRLEEGKTKTLRVTFDYIPRGHSTRELRYAVTAYSSVSSDRVDRRRSLPSDRSLLPANCAQCNRSCAECRLTVLIVEGETGGERVKGGTETVDGDSGLLSVESVEPGGRPAAGHCQAAVGPATILRRRRTINTDNRAAAGTRVMSVSVGSLLQPTSWHFSVDR